MHRIPKSVKYMKARREVVLFDTPETFENLLPLSYTRPIADFRVGIDTIRSKWERLLTIDAVISYDPVDYLSEKYPCNVSEEEEALYLAGNIIPDEELVKEVEALAPGEWLTDEYGIVAANCRKCDRHNFEESKHKETKAGLGRINYVFDIFRKNGEVMAEDYRHFVSGRQSAPMSKTVTVIGDTVQPDGTPSVFIEEGALAEGCIFNVKGGPIYIGKECEIMEGSTLRGPIAMCRKSKVRMGSKIYGGTTLGPYCKVGGEIDNAVILGFSNKAHDGYLGNAVLGEWCNLGAGTNASNLKNDYSKIRIWNYRQQKFMRTDMQFCGLIMGDHSKAGVNCMFNTATVIGVGVNIHGSGFPRVFVPSFSEGSPEGGFTNVSIDKFMKTAALVMSRRGLELTDVDRRICEYIYKNALRFKSHIR